MRFKIELEIDNSMAGDEDIEQIMRDVNTEIKDILVIAAGLNSLSGSFEYSSGAVVAVVTFWDYKEE